MYKPVIPHEEEVMAALLQGSKFAFEEIYNGRYLLLFHFVHRMVSDQQAAEDITTDSFLKLWIRHKDFEDLSKLDAFIFTIAKNACLNYLRDRKRQEEKIQSLVQINSFEEQPDLAESEISLRVLQYIYIQIGQLPPQMQAVLRAHLEGKKNPLIADELGLAEKTVRNLKAEALKLLRIRFSNRDFAILEIILFTFSRGTGGSGR